MNDESNEWIENLLQTTEWNAAEGEGSKSTDLLALLFYKKVIIKL